MGSRAAIAGWVMALTFGSLGLAFGLRWLLQPVLRGRSKELVDRWWVWAPLVAVVALIWVYAPPLLAVLFTAAAVALARLHPDVRRSRALR